MQFNTIFIHLVVLALCMYMADRLSVCLSLRLTVCTCAMVIQYLCVYLVKASLKDACINKLKCAQHNDLQIQRKYCQILLRDRLNYN